MPELPEVETIRIGLAKLVPGLVFARVDFDWPKGFPNLARDVSKHLIGARVLSVKRRGKALVLELSSGYSLVIHLKMTGQLVFNGGGERFGGGHPNDSLIGDLPDKSTRVIFSFKNGAKLFFNDQRKFGWVRLMPSREVSNLEFIKKLGPEPLASGLTAREFTERFHRRPNTSIKAALLDQTVIAGVGNIYADESLWGARLHPAVLVKNVSIYKFEALFRELKYVLKLSIEKGGSSDRNYVDAEGKKGSYLSFARVFRREGQPCPRCGTKIIKIRVAGRGTHICPHCQRWPK